MKCWPWKNGINFTPLYKGGNYADLAKYIRKDVSGKKRLKTSRNLTKPEIKVTEGKRENIESLNGVRLCLARTDIISTKTKCG